MILFFMANFPCVVLNRDSRLGPVRIGCGTT
jgi:hypothetical protein